jgi:hypothetical protein
MAGSSLWTIIRKILCFAAILGAGLLVSFGTWLYHLPQMPPLLQNLPPWDRKVLTARLLDRFPIGSPEADLIHQLWLEGFRPEAGWDSQRRIVRFGSSLIVCRLWGTVTWTAGGDGKLTGVSGSSSTDCL